MEQYEIEPLVTKLYLKNKESWEQTRLLGYITAQTQSTKKLKPTDIIKFPWEEVKVNIEVSNEDRARLIEKAKNFKLNKHG